MSECLIESRALQKAFKKGRLLIPVLKGIDFQVFKGETVAVVGASGAGKSTLLHILGTLDEPTGGQVFFEGENIFKKSEDERCYFRNRHLGFVFQFHYLLPEFTALENVMLPGFIADRHESALKSYAKDLLTEVGLGHRLHHKPGELSGGESQRVAVARALLMKPDLLFGDELTGNLDSENGEHLLSLLLNLNRSRKVTIVLVTHDFQIARKMSRVVEIKDGFLQNHHS